MLHPRSSPAREGLTLRQAERAERSAAPVDPDGAPLVCATGTGGGRPGEAPAPLDRRDRAAADNGNIGGTPARLYGEDEERTLMLPPPPPPPRRPRTLLLPLPPLVSRRLRWLPELLYPELLYPERGLMLFMEARPSLRGFGLGLPRSDSGDVEV